MMYRLLQDLVGWKCNFYIRCKLWCAIVFVILVVSLELSYCSGRSDSARTFEHGIFRHDKPWKTISPPFPPQRDDISRSTTERIVPPVPPNDSRDRYTYERFKRSVTTLNFHPKPPKNESVDLKPLRVFKYITEDDVIKPSTSERHSSTIFHSLESGAVKAPINDSSHQQIMGGAKVNLKAKLEKSQKDGGNNNNIHNASTQLISNEANTDASGSKAAQSKISSPKPENILIFKPSLAIRKKSNKTSLIPSGNHPQTKLLNNGNSIAASSITTTQESTDPNSSTVNDRSLIHNLLFDSVVMLSEEGQKQLLHQQHQTVEPHREKTRSSIGSGDDEIKYMSANPSSTFTSSSSVESNSNATISKKSPIISSSLPITNKFDVKGSSGGNGGNSTSSMATRFVENLMHQINGTITGNKDGVVIKVVKTKSKKGKKGKKPRRLDVDDVGQDGSERSRRSPFRSPAQRRNMGALQPSKGGQLARAALFRRVNMPRVRHNMGPNKQVKPRLMSVPIPGKPFIARTILPMRPMPMMPQPSKLTMMQGPIGPGPVGIPISAIKVTNLNNFNNNKNNNNGAPSPTPGQNDQKTAASRNVYSFKPLPTDTLLNEESSYYSPTYKRFKNRFHDQISSIMDSQRELDGGKSRWEPEPRFPSRQDSRLPKHRSRSSSRRHRPPPDRSMERERERDRHVSDRHVHDRHHSDSRLPERERDHRDRHDKHEKHDRHDRPRSRPQSRHHSHRNSPRSKKISSAKYTYPKNAENIQDILKYFDKEAPPFGGPGGPSHSDHSDKSGSAFQKRQPSTMPERQGHPKLADLSGEFRDVHASLLKDIKEFAKRPNLFGSSGDMKNQPRSPFDSFEGTSIDHIDDIFNLKPKPVREMIKPDLYSLENIRERIALKRGKLHGKFRDKDHHLEKDRGEDYKDSHHQDHVDDDEFYDAHHKPHSHHDDAHSSEHVKTFSKEDYDESPFSKKSKLKDVHDDTHTIFPSSHYHRDHKEHRGKEHRDSDNRDNEHRDHSTPFGYHSAEFPKETPFSNNKPLVIKRPESFRVRESEVKKKPDQDFFWNTFNAGFEKPPSVSYDAPLVIKSPSPSVLHQQPQPQYNPYNPFGVSHGKPVSAEDEDIVEIHTGGGPSGSASAYPSADQQMKQERLKKMYMDVLHQKMQLEAALYRPGGQNPSIHAQQSQLPQHSPIQLPLQMPQHNQMQMPQHNQMQMQQHHQMQMPQHSPVQISQHPSHHIHRMPPQLSGYPPSSSINSQLTGHLGFPRRKKPMRMKIHIYPNGHDGIEQGIEAANLLAAGGFGTSGFSASNPPGVVAVPPKEPNAKMQDSAMPSGPQMQSSPTGYGQHGASGPGPINPGQSKNKNVVLHLHVHRRNDMMSPLELEAEGSNAHQVTAKPLTYKEIFDEQVKSEQQQQEQPDMTGSSSSQLHHSHRDEEPLNSTQDTGEREEPQDDDEETERERDKSVSMEVPIHDEKIEDVLHSIMKLRNKPDNRKKRS